MSHSAVVRTLQSGSEEPNAAPARRSRRPGWGCRFCGEENAGDVVDAGGDVGRVHRTCFIEWDRRQEALEAATTVPFSLPHPGEYWSELEIVDGDPLTRAA